MSNAFSVYVFEWANEEGHQSVQTEHWENVTLSLTRRSRCFIEPASLILPLALNSSYISNFFFFLNKVCQAFWGWMLSPDDASKISRPGDILTPAQLGAQMVNGRCSVAKHYHVFAAAEACKCC